MSFVGFLGSVAGERSDVSEVLSPKGPNGQQEHVKKPNSIPSTDQ